MIRMSCVNNSNDMMSHGTNDRTHQFHVFEISQFSGKKRIDSRVALRMFSDAE